MKWLANGVRSEGETFSPTVCLRALDAWGWRGHARDLAVALHKARFGEGSTYDARTSPAYRGADRLLQLARKAGALTYDRKTGLWSDAREKA